MPPSKRVFRAETNHISFTTINYLFTTAETRIEGAKDKELKKILEHNRDEEKEHVAMLVEWIRKNDSTQDKSFEEHD